MSRFLGLANDWLKTWRHAAPGQSRDCRTGLSKRKGHRPPLRKDLVLELFEERVLLSQTGLESIAAVPGVEHAAALPTEIAHVSTSHLAAETAAGHTSAAGVHLLRTKKVATQLTVAAANGVLKGTASIQATLVSNGTAVAGQVVRFTIKGHSVGKAVTDAQGLAVLPAANLKGLKVGTYAKGVVATYNGTSSHNKSTAKGALTVSQFGTSLSGVSAFGSFGGSGTLTSTFTSHNTPIAGQTINFSLNGKSVGTATTNSQGLAVLTNAPLAGVNAGVQLGAVKASFVGGLTYQTNSATGNLTVIPGKATVALSGLSQSFDGTARSVSVTTDPAGLATSVTYKDANGNSVASPTALGNYSVNATITDPNYVGSAIWHTDHRVQCAVAQSGRFDSDLRRDGEVGQRDDRSRRPGVYRGLHRRERQPRDESRRRGQLPRDRHLDVPWCRRHHGRHARHHSGPDHRRGDHGVRQGLQRHHRRPPQHRGRARSVGVVSGDR